ncbi:MAG: hypothetical protein LBV20_08195, partial [Treponema sp.]|nr:hypothetical protein [Treponema sp.]
MKKVLNGCAVIIAVMVTVLLMSCENSAGAKPIDSAETFFKENPVTVNWRGSNTDAIESYAAEVEVYTMNNRKDTSTSLQQTYRMAVKTIDG